MLGVEVLVIYGLHNYWGYYNIYGENKREWICSV